MIPSCELPPEAPFSLEDLERLIETDPRFHASMAEQGASYRDSRVRSVVALAPAAGMALTAESLRRIAIPTLFFVGDRDNLEPGDSNASRIAKLIHGSDLIVLPRAGHYTFLAECGAMGRLAAPAMCTEEAGVCRRAVHERVAEEARKFFDATLAGH